jgi:hypothetical protein
MQWILFKNDREVPENRESQRNYLFKRFVSNLSRLILSGLDFYEIIVHEFDSLDFQEDFLHLRQE